MSVKTQLGGVVENRINLGRFNFSWRQISSRVIKEWDFVNYIKPVSKHCTYSFIPSRLEEHTCRSIPDRTGPCPERDSSRNDFVGDDLILSRQGRMRVQRLCSRFVTAHLPV